ncbi:Rpn family recombination-promoting nuclease/putative transposase [Massilia sp. SR12]
MCELLTTFFPADLAPQLDLVTLERVNGSYASDAGSQRHGDMVWRVQLAGRWLYLYVLMEFQSTPDPYMALRMRVYVGLLQQDLVKRHELPASGRLPPVLPLVMYSGLRPWRASRSMSGLVMAGLDGVAVASSQDEYLLLDFPKLFSEQPQLLSRPLAALLSLRFMDGRRSGQGALGLIDAWLRK